MTYETYAGNFPICSRLNEPVSEEVTPIKINDQLHAWLLINEPLRNDALGPGSGKIKYTVAIEVCIFSCIFLCSLGLFRPDLSFRSHLSEMSDYWISVLGGGRLRFK